MKVALVRPMGAQNAVRGIGFYTERLFAALKKSGADIDLINFSWLSGPYKKYDVIHFPYFEPFFLTLPFMIWKNSVVTVHDLTQVVFSKQFPRGFKGELKWQVQKFSLRYSDAIITDSFSSQADIHRITHYPLKKIEVIHLAPDESFKPVTENKYLDGVREKYSLPEKYVLYVGDINWNKNLVTLVRACQKIGVDLVLPGKSVLADEIDVSHPSNKYLGDLLKALKNNPKVHRLGFVPTADLVGIYNLAGVYVQPSVYEGFGLPVLEAMSCGTPVVCGKNSSLSEIAEEAAIYTDITSEETLAEKINKILHLTRAEREDLAKVLTKQAGKFSWEKTARETYAVYEKVLERV